MSGGLVNQFTLYLEQPQPSFLLFTDAGNRYKADASRKALNTRDLSHQTNLTANTFLC